VQRRRSFPGRRAGLSTANAQPHRHDRTPGSFDNVDAGSDDSTTGDAPITGGFLPEQPERRTFESVFARVVATAGIVGVGTALGAILIATNVAGWITGLVVSIVTVALAAMLWRSRRL
jgi:tetrahydromethanopterin S-methyltransferase subunit F